MDIIQCPYCSMRVVPMSDGSCPSCQRVVDPEKARALLASELSISRRPSPDSDYDQRKLEQRKGDRKGLEDPMREISERFATFLVRMLVCIFALSAIGVFVAVNKSEYL